MSKAIPKTTTRTTTSRHLIRGEVDAGAAGCEQGDPGAVVRVPLLSLLGGRHRPQFGAACEGEVPTVGVCGVKLT